MDFIKNKEEKSKVIEDFFYQLVTMADNLTLATGSPRDAVSILKRVIQVLEDRINLGVSEEFIDALNANGQLTGECEGCNKFHFCTIDEQGYYENGQLKYYLELEKSEPKKFISHRIEYLDIVYIAGKTFVLDCDCDSILNYERFFWNHRYIINEFFNNRVKKLHAELQDAQNVSSNVSKNIDDLS